MSNICKNAGSNQQLMAACSCESAANSLDKAVKQYEQQVQQHGIDCANYMNAWNNYQYDHQNWVSRRDQRKSDLANEDKYAKCGACGSNDGCPSGWGWNRNNNGCWGDWLPGTGCQQVCRRTSDQIDRDMSNWYASNPAPQQPGGGWNGQCNPCSTCNAPTGNDITCCSQLFSDIKADSANFSNISQNCKNTINDMIKKAIAPKPPPKPTFNPDTTGSEQTSLNLPNFSLENTNMIIPIIVISVISTSIFILVLSVLLLN